MSDMAKMKECSGSGEMKVVRAVGLDMEVVRLEGRPRGCTRS